MRTARKVSASCFFVLLTLLTLPTLVPAAPGDLDLAFSQDGKLFDFLRHSGGDDIVQGTAIQPDGKIVAVGQSEFGEIGSCGISRYNTDGSVDLSFDGDGSWVLPTGRECQLNAVAIQSDLKIVAVGEFRVASQPGGRDFIVIRYNPDGSLDSSFDTDGVLIMPIGSGDDRANGVVIRGDGKIVVTGYGNGQMVVVRYNPDGTLDTSFDSDGKAFTSFQQGGEAFAITLQQDGRIVVAGRATVFTAGGGTETIFALARFREDGLLDGSFDGDGMLSMQVGISMGSARSVEIQPDGKIVAAGFAFPNGTGLIYLDFAVIRLNPDGTPDTTFDSDGIALPHLTDSHDSVFDMVIQSDGKIVAAGRAGNGGTSQDTLGIVRLNIDGSLDSSFNGTGIVMMTGNPRPTIANTISLQQDGKLVAGGTGIYCCGSSEDFTLVRYNADGTPDNSFGAGGRLNHDTSLDRSFARAVAMMPGGKFFVAGVTGEDNTRDFAVIKYNSDGSPDLSFGIGGKVVTPVTPDGDEALAVAIQPDGKVVVAGSGGFPFDPPQSNDAIIVRYNPDGTLDQAFDGDGKVVINLGGTEAVTSLSIQADGKIVTGGYAWIGGDAEAVLTRLNTDGSFDSSFDTDGKLVIPSPATQDVSALTIQPDGKIVATGRAFTDPSYDVLVLRVNPDGTLDNSFDGDGKVTTNVLAADVSTAVAMQADGKIVVGGWAVDGGNEDFFVVRYNSNGSLDTAFDFDGKQTTSLLTFDRANAISIQANGKIVLGGASSSTVSFGSLVRGDLSMVRYNPNGSLDTSFSSDGKLSFDLWGSSDDAIHAMALDSNGRILVVGQGSENFAVARIEGDFVANRTRFDFDGDGKAEVAVYRPSTGVWYQLFSSGIPYGSPTFGIAGDVPIPADFDGDGKTDTGIYRPSSGDWWYRTSSDGAIRSARFGGQSGDIPLSADINNDGTDDFVIFRPSNNVWYRLTTTGVVDSLLFGAAGDQPIIGDFDGDGKADQAIFRPSSGDWWYASSATGGAFRATHWGQNGDIPAPADFDGDGKTDMTVFRPSNGGWYVLNSSDLSYTIVGFGLSGDRPVPADYDGDGKADIAVYRPSTGVWYMLQSSSGSAGYQWGLSTDVAIPNAFTQP
jgi:uncharacterized delta-60 repeat protein